MQGTQLLLAAGAMPAMDWMSSAALEALDEVTITQTKKPDGCRKGTNGVSTNGVTANVVFLTEGPFGYSL